MKTVKTLLVCLGFLALPTLAHAQAPSYDLAFWLANTADPNVTPPVAASGIVNYFGASVTCGLPKVTRTTTLIVNPTSVHFDDPTAPATADCRISTITAQRNLLPNDMTQYRVAGRQVVGGVSGAWSALSGNFFARNPPPASLNGVVASP